MIPSAQIGRDDPTREPMDRSIALRIPLPAVETPCPTVLEFIGYATMVTTTTAIATATATATATTTTMLCVYE